MTRSIRAGALVKQYGRFYLHVFEVVKDDRVLTGPAYLVFLEDGAGEPVGLGTINSWESDLPHFLAHVHEFLRGQHISIQHMQRQLREMQDQHMRDDLQAGIEQYKARWQRVYDAVRELEPDYTFDPAAHPIPPPAQQLGPLIKRYGRFALYELIERNKEGQVLPVTRYRLFVDDGTSQPPPDTGNACSLWQALPIGNFSLENSDLSHVLQFARQWRDGTDTSLEWRKKSYQEAIDEEEKQRYADTIQQLERLRRIVEDALKELEGEISEK